VIETPDVPDDLQRHPVVRVLLALVESLRQMLADLRDELGKQRDELGKQRDELGKQRDELAREREENRELRRALLGPKSEKMPPIREALKTPRGEQTPRGGQTGRPKRQANRGQRKELPVVEHVREVASEQLHCPSCGGGPDGFMPLPAEVSYRVEFVPAHLVQEKWVREKMSCRCGGCIVTAPPPPTVSEGVHYGPALHAHVVVNKLADSLPLYRQAKRLGRDGLSIARSTLCDMFHRSADLLRPLYERILKLIAASTYVNADETRLPIQEQGGCRNGFVWTFIAELLIAYVFSASRSGETPRRLLEGSLGFLQVDGYSGYNPVFTPDSRTRVGCLGHLRRYFFKAVETAPDEAHHAMGQILELYRVEYEVAERGLLGTEGHLALRKTRSAEVMADLSKWLAAQKPQHLPQGPMGRAITYAQNNWVALSAFLGDPKLLLDNNVSERALRIVALGRKNYLFAGHDVGAENLAVLQTLVATCEINGVNPLDYLADVLVRIQAHPMHRIEELLPHNWTPADQIE
jgi:transposase